MVNETADGVNAVAVTVGRQRIANTARWGVTNKAQIHYAQSRPIDGVNPLRRLKLPLTTDCSGFVTCCFAWVQPQAPDPNGNGFSGYGYTGSILAACAPIGESWLIPGDLVVFGPGTGSHVVVVVSGAGSACRIVSHGSEGSPDEYSLAQAKRMFASPARPVRVRGLPTKDLAVNEEEPELPSHSALEPGVTVDPGGTNSAVGDPGGYTE